MCWLILANNNYDKSVINTVIISAIDYILKDCFAVNIIGSKDNISYLHYLQSILPVNTHDTISQNNKNNEHEGISESYLKYLMLLPSKSNNVFLTGMFDCDSTISKPFANSVDTGLQFANINISQKFINFIASQMPVIFSEHAPYKLQFFALYWRIFFNYANNNSINFEYIKNDINLTPVLIIIFLKATHYWGHKYVADNIIDKKYDKKIILFDKKNDSKDIDSEYLKQIDKLNDVYKKVINLRKNTLFEYTQDKNAKNLHENEIANMTNEKELSVLETFNFSLLIKLILYLYLNETKTQGQTAKQSQQSQQQQQNVHEDALEVLLNSRVFVHLLLINVTSMVLFGSDNDQMEIDSQLEQWHENMNKHKYRLNSDSNNQTMSVNRSWNVNDNVFDLLFMFIERRMMIDYNYNYNWKQYISSILIENVNYIKFMELNQSKYKIKNNNWKQALKFCNKMYELLIDNKNKLAADGSQSHTQLQDIYTIDSKKFGNFIDSTLTDKLMKQIWQNMVKETNDLIDDPPMYSNSNETENNDNDEIIDTLNNKQENMDENKEEEDQEMKNVNDNSNCSDQKVNDVSDVNDNKANANDTENVNVNLNVESEIPMYDNENYIYPNIRSGKQRILTIVSMIGVQYCKHRTKVELRQDKIRSDKMTKKRV